jgi:hypothetical protein
MSSNRGMGEFAYGLPFLSESAAESPSATSFSDSESVCPSIGPVSTLSFIDQTLDLDHLHDYGDVNATFRGDYSIS